MNIVLRKVKHMKPTNDDLDRFVEAPWVAWVQFYPSA